MSAPSENRAIAGFATEMWPIEKPIPYARNPRNISESAISKVMGSIKEFDFRQPIVVDDEGVILVGHTRLLAAQRLGRTQVPVHVAHGLTPAQAKAYRLTDNRVGEESSWADELLTLELGDLKDLGTDLGLTGFNAGELDALFGNAAPSLDELEDEWGEHDETNFWPEIRLKVSPDTHERYLRLMASRPGSDDAERFEALLALAEEEAVVDDGR
jgi:hypothetical protein